MRDRSGSQAMLGQFATLSKGPTSRQIPLLWPCQMKAPIALVSSCEGEHGGGGTTCGKGPELDIREPTMEWRNIALRTPEESATHPLYSRQGKEEVRMDVNARHLGHHKEGGTILLRKCAKDIVSRTRALMNQNRLAPSVRNARHLAVSRGRRQTNEKGGRTCGVGPCIPLPTRMRSDKFTGRRDSAPKDFQAAEELSSGGLTYG